MTTPRLFGLPGPLRHLARRDPSKSDTLVAHNRLAHRWGLTFLHRRHSDLPESAAWGTSPIEAYFKDKLQAADSEAGE